MVKSRDFIIDLATKVIYDLDIDLIIQLTQIVDNIEVQIRDITKVVEKNVEQKRLEKFIDLIKLRKVALVEIKEEISKSLIGITPIFQKACTLNTSVNDLEHRKGKAQ